jgi:RNA polymerase sigma-70 factor (ECF subfamily)
MQSEPVGLKAAVAGDEGAFAQLVAPYRRELRAHCYRMSGSLHDADDLLQDSLLRAWKGLKGFEGRSSLRTWLYKVTTSACLDALDGKAARSLPTSAGPAADPAAPMGPPRLDPVWLEPCPEELLASESSQSPEALYAARESVAFAFLVALQNLPPKQRAVLILRDVLGMQATECAGLLDLTVAAVNSALQRARETLESRSGALHGEAAPPEDEATRTLLGRYVSAWELADVSALVALLHEEATLCMPPLAEWLEGRAAIGQSIGRMVLVPEARGAFRLVPTRANGMPAFAAYQRDPASGSFRPFGIHVLAIEDGAIKAITAFLDPTLLARLGLPLEPPPVR